MSSIRARSAECRGAKALADTDALRSMRAAAFHHQEVAVPITNLGICTPCGGDRDKPDQRYCRSCRARYMREYRAKLRQELKELRSLAKERRSQWCREIVSCETVRA